MPIERRWITPRECSERLGIHPKSCYRLISRRQIPAARMGRALRVDWLAVERRLEGEATGKAK
jgi:excisionase family DNA binding protein